MANSGVVGYNHAMTNRPAPLIDTQFDVALADRLARVEATNKHNYRPNSYLHKWWARRCGSTFRLILKHLVVEPALRDYYAPGGLAGVVVVDPMLGGGTTLHEALRMGASVAGADIDPIPVLQAQASLAPLPLDVLEEAFAAFLGLLRTELNPLWQTYTPAGQPVPLRYALYGLRRACACDRPVIQVDSYLLRSEGDGRHYYFDPADGAVVRGTQAPSVPPEPLLIEKTVRRCPVCGAAYADPPATPFYRRYALLAVAGRCPETGFFFKTAQAADHAAVAAADQMRPAAAPVEAFAVPAGPKSADLRYRQVADFRDLFTSRQLRYLAAAERSLAPVTGDVRLNLALLVSTSLEFNSLLCGYKGGNARRPGAIRHTFAHHGYAFPATALENNPVYPLRERQASGTLAKLFHDRLRRARQWALAPRERNVRGAQPRFVTVAGEVDQGVRVAHAAALRDGPRRLWLQLGSAARIDLPDAGADFVVTDPPYFDSVQYGDLAAYFRVWLRRLLPEGSLPPYALSAAAVDGRRVGSAAGFQTGLTAIFGECRRVLQPGHGRLIFTFHHWKPRAWSELTLALRAAGFGLVAYYVVHAENPVSVHIKGLRALTHDAILVLAPTGNAALKNWPLPAQSVAGDSARFTGTCAALLGYWLDGAQAGAPESAVHAAWAAALKKGAG